MPDEHLRDFSDVVQGEDYQFQKSRQQHFEISHKIEALALDPPHVLSKLSSTQLVTMAGAASGFLAGVIVCPFDVVKTRLQAQTKLGTASKTSVVKVFGSIVRNEGIRGLYRGLVPITIGYLPTWTIYFSVYEHAKLFYPTLVSSTTLSHVLSALTAGMASSIAVNPIWVVKTRLMIQTGKKVGEHTYYKGTINAFRTMYREEGVRVFYSGLVPSLFGLVHVGIHFPVYEKLKYLTGCENMNKNNKNYLWGLTFASAASKMIALTITYPHEILRTRMQIQEKEKLRLVDIVQDIYKTQSIKGFYSGYVVNLIRTVPASAVTLVSFEYFKTYLLEISGKSLKVSS
jgi:solute carrier family 25 folate transporter 32